MIDAFAASSPTLDRASIARLEFWREILGDKKLAAFIDLVHLPAGGDGGGAPMAGHGPLGRLLPVKIDAVDLPYILNATQVIDALDRDAVAAASRLFGVVGDPSTLGADDNSSSPAR